MPPSPKICCSLALLVCAQASCVDLPPPAVNRAGPTMNIPLPPPLPPPAPWQTRLSVADGYEKAPRSNAVILIRNATILTAAGKTIEKGSILIKNGKIAALADHKSQGDIEAPQGAEVIDAAGKFVTPGLIDTHSHIGVYPMPGALAHGDGNEATDPVTPHAQTVDAFWPQDPAIERAVAGGVTTIQVLPGSANLIGGRAITIKLRRGLSGRQMHLEGAPDGLKMACGENPKRVYGSNGKRAPMTRMGNLAGQRNAFLKAQKLRDEWKRFQDAEVKRLMADSKKIAEYKKKRDEYERIQEQCAENGYEDDCEKWLEPGKSKAPSEPELSEPTKMPDRDPGLETLAAAIEGRVLVQVHCYRADDMLAMLALSDEAGFKVRSFHHALEAYKIRDELKKRSISVSTWADWWGFKLEAYDGIPENIALIHGSGGMPVVHTDSPEGIQRMNQEAAKALASAERAGIAAGPDDAIKWITIYPAWTLGISERTGSLEVGKDADVVLWNRSPFSVYSVAERVWIDGVPTLDRTHMGLPRSDFELGQENVGMAPILGPKPVPKGSPALPDAPKPVPAAPNAAPKAAEPSKKEVIALTNALVHTGTGEVIENASVIIENGLIQQVGKNLTIPAGAKVIAEQGSVITPGFVDAVTSIGLVEIDLEKDTHDDVQTGPEPIHAAFRAALAFNPSSSVIFVTRSEGVTSAGVMPVGGLIPGQSAWVELSGKGSPEAIAKPFSAMHVNLRGSGDEGSRATAFLRAREAFDDARVYQKNKAAFERNQSRRLAASRLDLEALGQVLDGKIPVVLHVNRAPDVLSALALAKEFGLRAIIAGGAEAWKVKEALAAANTPVIVYPLESDPDSFETLSAREDNAALLHAAGVRVVLSTGSTHNARKLRQVAGNAVRAGLPLSAAVSAVTAQAASIFGMSATHGVLSQGKTANVVVWSGDPFEPRSRPLHVFIRGEDVPLKNRQTALFERYRSLP